MTKSKLATQTFNVPCRRFGIRLTVAKNERLPLVKEFALRLLHILGRCSVGHLQSFFGYSDREMSILVRDLDDSGLVAIDGNAIALTADTHAQFGRNDEGIPHIQTVESWNESFAIDFISFQLIHFEKRGENFRAYHDMTSSDYEKISRSKEVARASFADNFYEFVEKYKREVDEEERAGMSIYGISAVEARDKFVFPLNVEVSVAPDWPDQIQHDYPAFRTDAAQEQRAKLVNEVARSIAHERERSKFDDNVAWLFRDLFEDQVLGAFCKERGCYREELLQTLSAPEDRFYDEERSAALMGTVGVGENPSLVIEMMRKGVQENEEMRNLGDAGTSDTIYWQKPANEFWGRDESIYSLFRNLRRDASAALGERSKLALVANTQYERAREMARRFRRQGQRYVFDTGYGVGLHESMAPVEAFIWPGVFGGLIYYYAESSTQEFPIPFGFVTCDKEKLRLLAELLLVQWTGSGRKTRQVFPAGKGTPNDGFEVEAGSAFRTLAASVPKSRRPRRTLGLNRSGNDNREM